MPDVASSVVASSTEPYLSPGVLELMARRGPALALVGESVPGGSWSYAHLAARAADVRDRLGTTRRLVLVEGATDAETIASYLGALAGGHPVVLAAPGRAGSISEHFDVDVIVAGTQLTERRTGTAHDLHPDLSLLLSTSGTTGSAKLVRLSRQNLLSNARSIADYLALRPDDLAATTLPLHYCYGLSVLHSHLLVGAGLLLTEKSVAAPCFWDEFERAGATSLAGVPHTFDLMDRSGFADRDVPGLRYLTQAGGRMDPDAVRRWAGLGQRRGFDFFVMYGQTEATARMAYLPPHLAGDAPEVIGVPIPGGSFDIEESTGELVYSGPNVMLGYAWGPADLALGRTVEHLRTGDLARRRPDGLVEITGRLSRVAKVFGLRLDLEQIERTLAQRGIVVAAADGGDRLVVAAGSTGRAVDQTDLIRLINEEFGLPAAGVAVVVLPELPRLSSGKVDYAGIAALGHQAPPPVPGTSAESTLVGLYSRLLGRPATRDESFVSLGGDSLSYVECSLHLEHALGGLPADWSTRTIAELAGHPEGPVGPGRRFGVPIETSVLLRAFAIISIVGTHANLLTMLGGAHLLLGIVGFNFGRFQVTGDPGRPRLARMLRSVARIAVPSALVIGIVSLFTDGLGWRQILLLNSLTTSTWSEPGWYYWFIEALVYTLMVLALLMAIPWVARLEARHRFALPFGLALAGLFTRYGAVSVGGADEIHRAHVIFWLFALGWATAKADRLAHRMLLSALLVASVPGFFSGFERNAYVVVGMLLLVWVAQVRVPVVAGRMAGRLAGASLWIYLVHWQVYPWWEYRIPLVATLLSLAAGVLACTIYTELAARARDVRHRVLRSR